MLHALGLLGTFVFARSGVFEYELDRLGVTVLAVLTGVGGGGVHDMPVQERPAILYKGFYAQPLDS